MSTESGDSSMSLRFVADSLADTDRLGQVLADVLPDGTVIALCGTLGSGKTRLVQAIAAACDVAREEVISPTFVLCHQYVGRRTLLHLDAYRLQNMEEFLELGVDEALELSVDLVLIEWADRIASWLPEQTLQVAIDVPHAEQRIFCLRAQSAALHDAVTAIARRIG